MDFATFAQHNLLLVFLFVVLFLAVIIFEYFDNGRGVKKLSTQQTIKFMDQKNHLLIDLRHYIEFEKGYIQGAKQIAIDALKNKPGEYIKQKETPVLLIDQREFRAASLASYLKKQGFTEIYVLKGGLAGWKKEHLPLIKNKK